MKKPIVSLSEIVALEPQIAQVLRQAKRVRHPTWRAYERYKSQLSGLVGSDARNADLRNSAVFCVTIRALCDALKI